MAKGRTWRPCRAPSWLPNKQLAQDWIHKEPPNSHHLPRCRKTDQGRSDLPGAIKVAAGRPGTQSSRLPTPAHHVTMETLTLFEPQQRPTLSHAKAQWTQSFSTTRSVSPHLRTQRATEENFSILWYSELESQRILKTSTLKSVRTRMVVTRFTL